jgi:hypothetical protein
MRGHSDHVVVDIIKGAAAGATATWMMGHVTTWMYEREDREAREREDRARGDLTAYERAAEKGAGLLGVQLSEKTRGQVGGGIHWATGIGAGLAYALLRRRWRSVAAGKGLPFGVAFFLIVDELMNPLLGITPGPRAFPWEAHARGLGGHVAFGVTSELILEGLDRVA